MAYLANTNRIANSNYLQGSYQKVPVMGNNDVIEIVSHDTGECRLARP